MKSLSALLLFTLPLSTLATPVILRQSHSHEVRAGRDFMAWIEAIGDGLTYQWYRNSGTPIPGATSPELHYTNMSSIRVRPYFVRVTDAAGNVVESDPVTPNLVDLDPISVAAGNKGYIRVPGSAAIYHLFLPSSYHPTGNPSPVLITYNAGGGGMVSHFETVAEEKGWVIIGDVQSRNNQDFEDKGLFVKKVIEHALAHLNVDPNRIFVGGFSGGGWMSFYSTKNHAPLVCGVFSMGGWLGDQYSLLRDRYLSGLLVARANGDSDGGANAQVNGDRQHLQNFLQAADITDYSFTGGHIRPPDPVIRLVFDWFISRTTPSTFTARTAAFEKEARWKARITAGDADAVLQELIDSMFGLPRTPEALAAWRSFDFLLAHHEYFQTRESDFLSAHPQQQEIRQFFYYLQRNLRHDPDRSKIRSLRAVAAYLGESQWRNYLASVFADPDLFLSSPATILDDYILANNLWDRPEPPYTGDWDEDGHENSRDFLLGGDPLVADRPGTPGTIVVDGNAWAVFENARSGPWLKLRPLVSAGLHDWTAPSGMSRVERTRSGGMVDVMAKLPGGASSRGFGRFVGGLETSFHDDANRDGIPSEYHSNFITPLPESPGQPDLRSSSAFPGGATYYLEYLTGARVGKVKVMNDYLHVHSALLGKRGLLYHEVWTNVTGTDISAGLTAVADRPADFSILTTESEAPWHAEDKSLLWNRYFERTRGYFVPQQTGNHVFMISGDNQCEFRLSTSSDPALAATIASVNGTSGRRVFTTEPNQTSAPTSLTTGQLYYFEILHKEGSGEDHCTVFVTPPGGAPGLMSGASIECLSVDDLN